MIERATQRKLSVVGTVAAAAVAAACAAILSGTEACTLTTNDALPDAAAEPDALRPRVSVCNACSVPQCTGQWAVCLQSTDCSAIYACAQTGKPQDCICRGDAKGQPAYRALAACAEVSACGACNAQCKDSIATGRFNCTSAADGGVPLSIAQCAQPDAASDAPAESGSSDGAAGDADLDGAADASGDAGAAADASDDAATNDAEAGVPVLGDCTGCVNGRCGDPKKACGVGSSCDLYVQCASACGDAACFDRCAAIHASGKVALAELAKCTIANCSTACGF